MASSQAQAAQGLSLRVSQAPAHVLPVCVEGPAWPALGGGTNGGRKLSAGCPARSSEPMFGGSSSPPRGAAVTSVASRGRQCRTMRAARRISSVAIRARRRQRCPLCEEVQSRRAKRFANRSSIRCASGCNLPQQLAAKGWYSVPDASSSSLKGSMRSRLNSTCVD